MSKPEKIQTGAPVSWQDIRGDDTGDLMLATQIMNVMEQGIIVWSPDGTCELHNTRVFDVLELERDAIGIGTKRGDFLDAACAHGEFSTDILANTNAACWRMFHFNLIAPCHRVVWWQPMRGPPVKRDMS
jgi:hypothetical protein